MLSKRRRKEVYMAVGILVGFTLVMAALGVVI